MPDSGVPEHLIEGDDISDYAFVGDITEVIILSPSFHLPYSFLTQLIPTENSNIHRNPYIIASGVTENFDSAHLTFALNPSQYINLPRSQLTCPISCFIDPESKKWKTKKPMPISGTTISVTGMLTKIKRDSDHHPIFEIELDNIAYLQIGRQSGGSTGPSTSESLILIAICFLARTHRTKIKHLASSTSISQHSKRFNYDSAVPYSNIPLSSPIALGKRKEEERDPDLGEASEHDSKRSHTASDQTD
jgi:hypothetical protein